MRSIVLASTSPYRKALLQQICPDFVTAAPLCHEEIDPEIAPELQVRHLAQRKAESLAEHFPDALIIGSDQLFADPRGRTHGKPGTFERAEEQLVAMSGRTHTFYTGLALYDSRDRSCQSGCETFSVTLRSLGREQIRAYLLRERPFDCAGSFKIEGLGIALMEKTCGNDQTALVGLPLILLTTFLLNAGIDILQI